MKFVMNEESNVELAFLDTLLKWNDAGISRLVYTKTIHTDQSYTTALTIKKDAMKVLFPTFLIENVPLSQMMTYTKKMLE